MSPAPAPLGHGHGSHAPPSVFIFKAGFFGGTFLVLSVIFSKTSDSSRSQLLPDETTSSNRGGEGSDRGSSSPPPAARLTAKAFPCSCHPAADESRGDCLTWCRCQPCPFSLLEPGISRAPRVFLLRARLSGSVSLGCVSPTRGLHRCRLHRSPGSWGRDDDCRGPCSPRWARRPQPVLALGTLRCGGRSRHERGLEEPCRMQPGFAGRAGDWGMAQSGVTV